VCPSQHAENFQATCCECVRGATSPRLIVVSIIVLMKDSFFANLCEEKRKLELVLWSLTILFFSLDLALLVTKIVLFHKQNMECYQQP